jgi:TetR/AcrR family transcriptional regulator, cholesterol catabolism regulator
MGSVKEVLDTAGNENRGSTAAPDAAGIGPVRAPKRRDKEVLDAAAKVFHERGYADASVQDVADELGILKGSLYHYIDTKEDLLFRLLDETHDDVSRILEEVRGLPDLDALDRLRLYVQRQVWYNLDNIERVAVYYRDLERLGPERRRDIVSRRKAHEAFVADLIAAAQRQGAANPALDVQVLSRCIFATIIWTYTWFHAGRDARDHVARACADFAIRGVTGAAPRLS